MVRWLKPGHRPNDHVFHPFYWVCRHCCKGKVGGVDCGDRSNDLENCLMLHALDWETHCGKIQFSLQNVSTDSLDYFFTSSSVFLEDRFICELETAVFPCIGNSILVFS